MMRDPREMDHRIAVQAGGAAVQVCPDSAALAREAAEQFVAVAMAAIADRGRFSVALSGGSTPRALFTLLSGAGFVERVDWSRVDLFFGDERSVPPSDADSNYRMAHETLLARAPIPAGNVHRIHAELPDATRAAEEYEQELQHAFGLGPGQVPRFDLVLLGMGPDGHTASLFPGTAALGERQHLVVANWVEQFHTWRLTLTAPVLNHARHVIFLVAGADKAEALQAVLQGAHDPQRLPAQLIRPMDGDLLWLVDRAAAQLLADDAGRSSS